MRTNNCRPFRFWWNCSDYYIDISFSEFNHKCSTCCLYLLNLSRKWLYVDHYHKRNITCRCSNEKAMFNGTEV